MTFWACVLKPGQKSPAKLSETDTLHLSQACLHQPKAGKNYIQVQREGKVYSIACLEKDKREHECFDLFFDGGDTTFVSKGESEIHLMGYVEPMDDGMEESEEEGSETQVVPKTSPKASPKAAPAQSPKVQAAKSPKAEVAKSPKVEAAKSPKVEAAKSPKVSPKAAPAPAPEEEDDDDEEGEEEEELLEEGEEEELLEEDLLDEDDEEEEEEEDAKAAAVSAQLAKRKAASQPAASPAKKPKSEPAPAVAAPADGTAAYIQKLVKYLKDNGSTSIGQLGSKLPRPSGVPKMKALLDQNKDKFAVSGDKVSAK